MIILRIFINRIPDTWGTAAAWYLAGLETLLEVFLISVVWYAAKCGCWLW